MRVLVVGSGGREHALAWALSGSPLVTALFVAPGNPGTAALAAGAPVANVPIAAEDVAGLVRWAVAERMDLVVPGPEAPLVAGLADRLAAAGVRCCGPGAEAARLEGSKSFTKELCDAAGIPTARWERFDDLAEARDFIGRRGAPVVVKADGLAGGKGVVVAATEAEAAEAVERLLRAGPVVIEEALEGPEVSLFALCDGEHAVVIGTARDHKRVGDGDFGPNTGGMGAVSPVPGFDPGPAMDAVVRPALAEMVRRGTPFRGVLFAGLMLTADGPKLIEFNVRWGDPECQALLPRLRTDLLPALLACCDGELAQFDLRWSDEVTCAVVVAARGYPGTPATGGAIGGLAEAAKAPAALVFQAATREENGQVVADGGRVLTVVGKGRTVAAARDAAYGAVARLRWPDGFCRSDIGLSLTGVPAPTA